MYKTEPFISAINYAKSIGFEWGGDWKSFVDSPHLQYNYKGYGTDKGNVPYTMPTLTPSFPTGIYYIHTGGYAWSALIQVHGYLFRTGHGFDVKRGGDGSLIFLIGPFDTSAQNFRECELFLRSNGHTYELKTPEQAAEWKPKAEATPANFTFIETGGYEGPALLQVHTELFKVGYGFDVKRGGDGSIIFLVGPFDTAKQDFKNLQSFLDRNGHGYKQIAGDAAASWR